LHRDCRLEHVFEGNIEAKTEVMRRRERRRKQLLDGLKETKGYWKLKKEAPYRRLGRIRFGRDYGQVAKQTTRRLGRMTNNGGPVINTNITVKTKSKSSKVPPAVVLNRRGH
jgi:hypothetical protein